MGVVRPARARKPVLRPGFEVEAVSPRTRPSVVRAAVLARALDAAASAGGDDGDREEKEARLPVTAKRVPYSRDNWSAWEDQQLVQLVQKFGGKKWAKVADGIPGRKGKQCRERWHNHINPAVDKSSWTRAEDIVIHAGVYELGHKWAAIARRLPGRTDNQVKNRYNCFLHSNLAKEQAERGGAQERAAPAPPAIDDATLLLELQRRNAVKDAAANRRMRTALREVEDFTSHGQHWAFDEELRLATAVQIEMKRLKVGQDGGWVHLHATAWENVAHFVGTRSPKACSRRWAIYADAGVFDDSLVADLPQFAEDPKPASPARAASECSDAESFALDEVFANEGAVEYAELLCTEEYDEGPDAPPPLVEAAYSVKFQPRFWRAVDMIGIKYRCPPLPPPPPRPRRKLGTQGPRRPTGPRRDCAHVRSMKAYYAEAKRRAEAEAWEKSVFA